MKENIKIILFAVVLAVICSALLTGMKLATGKRQEANKLAFQRENILRVLEISLPENPSSIEINQVYDEKITETDISGIAAYQLISGGEVQAVAVSFEGPGLWNKIRGYLALDAKMETILGITFYEHEETPGLGGEIDKEWFREQFVGKPFRDESGELAIRIVKPGMASGANDIDGISGATITGDKVQEMLAVVSKQLPVNSKQ